MIIRKTRTWSNRGTHWHNHKYDCLSKSHKDYLGEYRVWRAMNDRCGSRKGYENISVCKRWSNPEHGFINFYKDMGKRPFDSKGRPYQIDRINCKKGYSPSNCRWITAKDNNTRRRSVHILYLWGEPYSVSEACSIFNIHRECVLKPLRERLDTAEAALFKQLIKKGGR